MGTTLTGTTPQDTYDSLIKVTDNGPLSGSLKKLTDGLGNDSSLSLSTTAASFSGTLAVTGNATFDTSTLVVDATNNRVGVGTATPDFALDVVRGSTGTVATFGIEGLTINPRLRIDCDELNNTVAFNPNYSGSISPSILFLTGEIERMRITSAGNVGIGTSSPAYRLDVAGASTAGFVTPLTVRNPSTNAASSVKIGLDAGNTIWGEIGASYNSNNPYMAFFVRSGSEKVRITDAGNVGIGTSAPESKLHIAGTASGSDVTLYIDNVAASTLNNSTRLKFSSDTGSSVSSGGAELNCTIVDAGNGAVDLLVKSWSGGAYTEKARFLAGGGLTFNGDTAAANALDDYEEGTFTPTIIGSTTAGTATYGGGQEGKYTKIGNVVYFQLYLGYSGGTGTGDLRIAGLPFTIPANDLPSFTFGAFLNVALTASNIPLAGGIASTNQITIEQIPTGGGSQTAVPYDASAVIQISGFYRV